MPCADKSHLQDEWANATNVYAKLVKALTSRMGGLPKDQYERQRNAVEEARIVSEKLRHTLDLHVLTHGC